MTKKPLDVLSVNLDADGRVVLDDADLADLALQYDAILAGGANQGCGGRNAGCTNNNCDGSNNTSECTNTGGCDNTTNRTCDNQAH